MSQAASSHVSNAPQTRQQAGHPLGPLVRFVRLERAVTGRLYALGMVAAAAAVLVAAWRIDPGRATMGTHRQLGLPPCGFLMITRLPCPTCGMTTSFAHTVRGQLPAAIRSQPAGFVLAVATVAAGLAGLFALVSGYRPAVNWYRVNPINVVWWAGAAFVLSWAMKMAMGLLDGSLPAGGVS